MRVDLPADFLRLPLAHRGYHDLSLRRPENTRAAAAAAVAAGYGIEIDVQPSSDGEAMVFHDASLGRLCGVAGETASRSAAELSELSVLDTDETIPTLSDLLSLVDGRVPLLIEIKDQDGAMGPSVGVLEAAVARALSGYDGPVAVMSFNPYSVAKMVQLSPQVARGLTTEAYEGLLSAGIPDPRRASLRDIRDFDRVGASFISHDVADLRRPRVTTLKAAGVPILCWTVRSPKQEAQARRVADNITFEGYAAPIPVA